VVQVAQHLPSKCETLTSNLSPARQTEREREREREIIRVDK
jgi:hypothetical protein